MPDDSFSVALLHMNGTDGSTTFTDESGKTWTANGNVQIDTAQSKFGGASGLFDGTGDFLTSADSADWQLDGGSNSNAWTVDFWLRFNSVASTGLLQQYTDGSNFWAIYYDNSTGLNVWIRSAASNIVLISNAWTASTNTWYHVAVVKNGTTGYMMFVDGVQIGTTQTDTSPMPNLTGTMRVGRLTNVAGVNSDLNGWMDELRISKGIARWTANFTPPEHPYPFLSVDTGAYTYTGIDVNFGRTYVLAVNPGSYTLAGQDVGVLVGYLMSVDTGSYILTGNAVGLNIIRVLVTMYILSTDVSKNILPTYTSKNILNSDVSKYAYRQER